MESVKNYRGRLVTFGVDCDCADYNAVNLRYEGGHVLFDLSIKGERAVAVNMAIPGEHYVWDATAAIAAAVKRCLQPDVKEAMVAAGLEWAARFSMECFAHETMDCYKMLTGEK
jgi:UDP-N-acetylmuramate-alanine ligase